MARLGCQGHESLNCHKMETMWLPWWKKLSKISKGTESVEECLSTNLKIARTALHGSMASRGRMALCGSMALHGSMVAMRRHINSGLFFVRNGHIVVEQVINCVHFHFQFLSQSLSLSHACTHTHTLSLPLFLFISLSLSVSSCHSCSRLPWS